MSDDNEDIISIDQALRDQPWSPFMLHAGIRTFDDVKIIMRKKLSEMTTMLDRRSKKDGDRRRQRR